MRRVRISRELRMIKFDHNWLTFAPSGRIPSFKKVPTSGLDACEGYNFYLGTDTHGWYAIAIECLSFIDNG